MMLTTIVVLLFFQLLKHLADQDSLPQPRGIDAYLDALQNSEGETFYLTHLSMDHLRALIVSPPPWAGGN